MIVYFSGSRYYKKEFQDVYTEVIEILKSTGVKVVDNTVDKLAKGSMSMSDEDKIKYHSEIVKLLDKADYSVFEATFPSTLHIGHEITLAIEKGKPVIVLYSEVEGKEPMLFKGISTEKVIWVAYNRKNLKEVLAAAIEQARKKVDVRFNFFVSPKILNYLDWVAKKRMEPRSVFLRKLIEKEMKKDKEFEG